MDDTVLRCKKQSAMGVVGTNSGSVWKFQRRETSASEREYGRVRLIGGAPQAPLGVQEVLQPGPRDLKF